MMQAITKMSLELRAALTDNGWWNPNALVVQPSVLVHPETKAETLQLYSFTTTLAPMAHEARSLCPSSSTRSPPR